MFGTIVKYFHRIKFQICYWLGQNAQSFQYIFVSANFP